MPWATPRPCPRAGCVQLLGRGQRWCPDHAAEHEQLRGSAAARGYDRRHQATRAELLPLAYGTACPLCGRLMTPGQDLDLDHTVPLRTDPTSRGDRIVHAGCNRGRRG